jgi:hypothetical protein
MKICNECLEEKDFSNFRKSGKYYRSKCKSCEKILYKNKDKVSEYNKKYYKNNKSSENLRVKKWRENNSEKMKIYSKKWSSENSNYRSPNYGSEEYKIKKKLWNEKNRESRNDQRIIKYNNDTLYRLKYCLRSLVNSSIKRKGFKKNTKTEIIIGLNFSEFKLYLESKFEPWMNWKNYGLYNGDFNFGWDIDHIIPISTSKSEEELLNLNHYTNLQPLCSKINRDIKKSKLWSAEKIYPCLQPCG